LDATYFKPFKNTFRNEQDAAMAKNNFLELDKITLVEWVDKALQQSSKNEKIKSRFRVCGIWPLNYAAMAGKFGSNEIFIATK
jgi:hypothetical protein